MSPSSSNGEMPREDVSFGGSLFGYDTLIRQGRDFVALKGEGESILEKGMRVKLLGDSRGYVPGGFSAGEEVEIVGFCQPFDRGSTDHVIRVSNGEDEGWVKPSNIAPPTCREPKNLAVDSEDAGLEAPPATLGVADPRHLKVLAGGAEPWNLWRRDNPGEVPRLAGADLRGIVLRQINLEGADLSGVEGYGIDLYEANLRRANLQRAFLQSASLHQADLSGADLSGASLSRSNLMGAKLRRATLTETKCMDCDFHSADLSRATVKSSLLTGSRLFDTDLRGATIVDSDLMTTLVIRTNLQGATLSGCRVHGAAVWKILTDEHTRQTNLIVTDINDPTVTTDKLEIAQLIHLLINAAAIRDVINSMTGRAVLLLGRFTEERMAVLTAIATRLRELGDLPIIFNFDKPVDRSVSETIRILAGLSKFMIVDLTDPQSSPYESHLTIPDLAVPVFPIIERGQAEFSMFEDLYDYDWLLEGFAYRDIGNLLANLDVIRQEALGKREQIAARRLQRKKGFRDVLSRQP